MSAVEHLGVGSRAQHWKATAGLRPVLFVTHEPLPVAGAEALEDAYAAAADLAFALDVVVSSVPSSAGTWTLPVAGGALSVTPWVVGEALGSPGPPLADRADTEDTVRMLARLHAAHPPRRTPRWVSGVEPDLGAALRARAARPWDSGPLGAPARAAVAAHLGDVDTWTAAHRRLVTEALDRPWVVTHGAPHPGHLLRTPVRTLLVDWASLALAPRERDLHVLVEAGHADLVEADPGMVRLFVLERRLQTISRYAARLDGPHPGGPNDQVALQALRHELSGSA